MKNVSDKLVYDLVQKKNRTYIFEDKPVMIASAGTVGREEGKGPLGDEFDFIGDALMGEDSWESAESAFHKKAVQTALHKAGKTESDIDVIFSGDLLNQSMGSCFSIKDMKIPFCGLYGACSTMAYSLGMAGVFVESGCAEHAVAATSSHFCSAEKQFRQPLEYGGQRPPTSQRTVTGAGAAVISKDGNGPRLAAAHFGMVKDYGVTDENNMGAAMAPAAADTIWEFLKDTGTKPEDYDLILTGDLGYTGSELLIKILKTEKGCDISEVHADCGIMIFDRESQDVHCGGSGCACSGTVVCTYIHRMLREGRLKRVLFVGTGALVSTVSPLQGDTVPGIAHAVLLEGCL